MLVSILPIWSLACDCFGPKSFCEVINLDEEKKLTIIKAKKISESNYNMNVKVLEVLQGEESRSELTIIGDSGADCLVNISIFDNGEELILAISKNDGSSIRGDYFLSHCGLTYVRCKDLINPFTGEVEDISACLGTICNCSENNPTSFSIYPNPSDGILRISMDESEITHTTKLKIYSITGQLIQAYSATDLVFSDNILELNISNLPAGIYLIEHDIGINCQGSRLSKVIIT